MGAMTWDEWRIAYERIAGESMNDPDWKLGEYADNIKKFYYDFGDSPEDANKIEASMVGLCVTPKGWKTYNG